MPAEHRYIDGTLRQGYFCANCGCPTNMLASHYIMTAYQVWSCKANPKLVSQLCKANPPRGVKPHFVISPNTFRYHFIEHL